MKHIWKSIIWASIWGIIQGISIWNMEVGNFLSDIILNIGFSEMYFTVYYLIEITVRMLPFFSFQILFGMHIYKHFCSASVYYFSRCTKRTKWFLKEALKIYFISMVFSITILVAGIIVSNIKYDIIIDRVSILVFFYCICCNSLWLSATTIAVNIIAIIGGSGIGFAIVGGLQSVFIALLKMWDNILPLHNPEKAIIYGRLLQINPMAHLIVKWHSSRIFELNEKINILNIVFDLNSTITIYVILNGIILVMGCIVVKNKQILTNVVEMEE